MTKVSDSRRKRILIRVKEKKEMGKKVEID